MINAEEYPTPVEIPADLASLFGLEATEQTPQDAPQPEPPSEDAQIAELLDQLAETQSAADAVALKRDHLLQEVRIPPEIADAQKRASAAVQAIQAEVSQQLDALNFEMEAELKRVIVPSEIAEAYQKIEDQRREIRQRYEQSKQIVQHSADTRKLKAVEQSAEAIAQATRLVEQRQADIRAEFAGPIEAAKQKADALTTAIKARTATYGKSVKGKYFHAVFLPGKVTWKTEVLDKMIENPKTAPEVRSVLEVARNVGKSSSRIDPIKGKAANG
jgi:hypothetical protein